MPLKTIIPGIYQVSLGFVNVFLLDGEDGLTLIDSGTPGSERRILRAVHALHRQPRDVRRILLTHLHFDHVGSLAALKAATGAVAYMHPLDAELVTQGTASRPTVPAPGALYTLMHRLFVARRQEPSRVEPAAIDHYLNEGDDVPGSGGLQALHTPGHTAGHLAFYWPHRDGLLFTGDAAANFIRPGYAPIYEDLDQGKASLARLATLSFNTLCFSHGRALFGPSASRQRQRWGQLAK